MHIEGQIDRVDILENGHVKIIDYKSGFEKWSTKEAVKGYRLQLMLYLKAASQGRKGEAPLKPAGVFYFHIADSDIKAVSAGDALSEELEKEIAKGFRMSGIVAGEENVSQIIGNWPVVSGYKGITKSGEFYKDNVLDGETYEGLKAGTEDEKSWNACILTQEAYDLFSPDFDHIVGELAENLITGTITARPKKTRYKSQCGFCSYRSICRFEIGMPGCEYENV